MGDSVGEMGLCICGFWGIGLVYEYWFGVVLIEVYYLNIFGVGVMNLDFLWGFVVF